VKIGLIGEPEAGKDDVVSHVLITKYGFIRFAFADEIKRCYYSESGITEEYFKSCRGTPEENRIRKELWEFSDKVKEKKGNLYFINKVLDKANKYENSVITDIRTEDELDSIIATKPKIIIVSRNHKLYYKDFDKYFPETRILNRKIHNCLQIYRRTFFKFDNVFDTLENAREGFKEFYERFNT